MKRTSSRWSGARRTNSIETALFLNEVRIVSFVLALLAAASASAQQQTWQWSGFALVRGASAPDSGPLVHEELSSQLQLGVDWKPSPMLGAHVHLIARTGAEESRRGAIGIAEAYVEANLRPNEDRLRLRGGAMFLPTSRENVDALWENPYAITSSALNSWWGEELRPIGIDASYFRGRLFGGATIFRGNDTLGSVPPVRGWRIADHWALLGEHVPVDPEYFTSVSAENDGRLGWSARGGWNGANLFVQLTHLDNRGDGHEYDPLFNWGTRFDIVAAEYTLGDWTIAAESGWGPTFLIVEGIRYTNDLRASYLLVSRRWARARVSVRAEEFAVDANDRRAVTVAAFWTPLGSKVRIGGELTAAGSDRRALVEARYRFRL